MKAGKLYMEFVKALNENIYAEIK